jgi:hypothetical protein
MAAIDQGPRRSRHGMGRSAWGSYTPRTPRPAPAPFTACGAQHPHNSWSTNKKACSVNVHGLADGKHDGPHHCHTGGVNVADLWNDAGQVWDSDPIESVPPSERGAFCRDAWGPAGLAVCFNPHCKDCRGGR